jgi:hypothetical protein
MPRPAWLMTFVLALVATAAPAAKVGVLIAYAGLPTGRPRRQFDVRDRLLRGPDSLHSGFSSRGPAGNFGAGLLNAKSYRCRWKGASGTKSRLAAYALPRGSTR